MRAVIYARVSSAAQRERDTIASQLRVLPEYVERQGWELVRPAKTYVDDGRSAKADTLAARAGLQALLRDAGAGLFDVVAVVDLDRITRTDQWDERGAILGAFQRAGVKIAEASTGTVHDLADGRGDLLVGLKAFFAAEENRKRAERIKRGKDVAIARGKKPAGPTPFGLTYDRATGEWGIDADGAALVRELYHRVAAGESCEVLAQELNDRGVPTPTLGLRRNSATEWRRERVWQIVTSPTYRGQWTADKRRRLTLSVPAIVSDADWYRAQEALERYGRRGLRRTRHVYLVEAIGRCERCGALIGIAGSTSSRGGVPYHRNYYVCAHRRRPPRGTERCDLRMRYTRDVDDRLWEAVHILLTARWDDLVAMLAERRRAGERAAEGWESDVAGYRQHLARLAKAEEVLLAQFRRGRISEAAIDRELEALGRERAFVARQLEAAQRAAAGGGAGADGNDLMQRLERLRRSLRRATPAIRRDIVRALIPGTGDYVVRVGDDSLVATVSLAIAQGQGSLISFERECNRAIPGLSLRLVA